MKTLKLLLWWGKLSLLIAVNPASGQSPPSLGLQFSAGQPTLSLTGTAGTVLLDSIRHGSFPHESLGGSHAAASKGGSSVWSDPSAPAPSQRPAIATSSPLPFLSPLASRTSRSTSRIALSSQPGSRLSRSSSTKAVLSAYIKRGAAVLSGGVVSVNLQ
jgi:hypothetical protein